MENNGLQDDDIDFSMISPDTEKHKQLDFSLNGLLENPNIQKSNNKQQAEGNPKNSSQNKSKQNNLSQNEVNNSANGQIDGSFMRDLQKAQKQLSYESHPYDIYEPSYHQELAIQNTASATGKQEDTCTKTINNLTVLKVTDKIMESQFKHLIVDFLQEPDYSTYRYTDKGALKDNFQDYFQGEILKTKKIDEIDIDYIRNKRDLAQTQKLNPITVMPNSALFPKAKTCLVSSTLRGDLKQKSPSVLSTISNSKFSSPSTNSKQKQFISSIRSKQYYNVKSKSKSSKSNLIVTSSSSVTNLLAATNNCPRRSYGDNEGNSNYQHIYHNDDNNNANKIIHAKYYNANPSKSKSKDALRPRNHQKPMASEKVSKQKEKQKNQKYILNKIKKQQVHKSQIFSQYYGYSGDQIPEPSKNNSKNKIKNKNISKNKNPIKNNGLKSKSKTKSKSKGKQIIFSKKNVNLYH